jgi:hypothetical protein
MFGQRRSAMSADADRLREAFASRQLDRLIDLIDADVTRRGLQQPGQPDYPDRASALAAIQPGVASPT